MTGSVANHGAYPQTAYLTTPLGESVGLVLSGHCFKTDGFCRNVCLNADAVDNQKDGGVDARVVYRLNPSTTVDFKSHCEKLSGASIA